MDPVGTLALVAAAVSSVALALGPRRDRRVEVAVVGSWALALAVWAWRLGTVDLRLTEVARLTRVEVPTALRLAAAWAGPAGSLLVWFAVVVTVLIVALDRGRPADTLASPWPRRAVGGFSVAGAVTLLSVAAPFRRLDEPALVGAGLVPVLEHPMMLVHPPLLYAAQAAVLGAALAGARRSDAEHDSDDPGRSIVRWTLGATALLVAATLLGAWWAHDELGWGGWWAWDPVENTALAPLVCLLAALHARAPVTSARWRLGAAACVLAGIAMTRSGLPDSVHAFAPSGRVALLFLAATVTVLVLVAHSLAPPATGREATPSSRRVPALVGEWVTGVGAGWTLTVIVAAGIAAMWLGTRSPSAGVDGGLLGPALVPVGLATLTGLVVAGFRRGQRAPSLLAHAGVLVFGIGVVGSLATTTSAGTVDVGATTLLGGREVTVLDAEVVEDRPDVTRLDVTATIDGRTVVASILDHPDLGRTRARPGRLVDATGETELVVSLLAEDRARVEIRRHPGLPELWLGGAMVAAGIVWAALRPGRDQSSERRRRLAASSESSAEPPSSDPAAASGPGDGGAGPATGPGADGGSG